MRQNPMDVDDLPPPTWLMDPLAPSSSRAITPQWTPYVYLEYKDLTIGLFWKRKLIIPFLLWHKARELGGSATSISGEPIDAAKGLGWPNISPTWIDKYFVVSSWCITRSWRGSRIWSQWRIAKSFSLDRHWWLYQLVDLGLRVGVGPRIHLSVRVPTGGTSLYHRTMFDILILDLYIYIYNVTFWIICMNDMLFTLFIKKKLWLNLTKNKNNVITLKI